MTQLFLIFGILDLVFTERFGNFKQCSEIENKTTFLSILAKDSMIFYELN